MHPARLIELDIGDLSGMHCDRERICQVLSNLIANALQHGDEQGVIRISARIADDDFILSVHNSGEPIAPAIMAQMFEPFSHPASDAPQVGLGLGLYIAKQIALAHGGYMDVQSSAAAGTLFSLHLPLVRAARAAGRTASP